MDAESKLVENTTMSPNKVQTDGSTEEIRPEFTSVEKIPNELKKRNRWVCHKNKTPYSSTGHKAKSNDPSTWDTLDNCIKACNKYSFDGLGFMLGDGYVGIDIDHCIDDGNISDMAKDIIKTVGSYTEVSLSGDGIHIICRGKLPKGVNARHDIGLEMYDGKRYFTMTGRVHKHFTDIHECTEQLNKVYHTYMQKNIQKTPRSLHQRGPISEGARNSTLTSIGGALRRRGEDYQTIFSALVGINKRRCVPPLDDSEVESIARSIAKYEPDVIASYEFNDVGDARYILDRKGDKMRHIHPAKPKESGLWLAWDGTRWINKGFGHVKRIVREGLEERSNELKHEANLCQFSEQSKAKNAYQHANRLGSSAKLDSVLKVLSTFEDIQAEYDMFDSEPYALNCKNGIVDLKDGSIRPHDSREYHSKIVDVVYDPDAQAPRWEQFINEITLGDEELAAYLQRAAGYSLIGELPEHAMFMPVGSRRNGKTTFLESIRGCLGDYAVTVQMDALMQRNSSGLNPDIPKLKGARFCTTSETESNQKVAAALLKSLSGGNSISGRELYMSPIEFRPYAKLWIDTNNPPYLFPRDKGLWARLQIIPFDACFEGREDISLRGTLRKERPGILNWLVEGAQMWLEKRLSPPKVVREKTAEIRGEQDTITGFIDDVCCDSDDSKDPYVPLKELYNEYKYWTNEAGQRPLGKQQFIKELEARGYIKDVVGGNIRVIRGLCLDNCLY